MPPCLKLPQSYTSCSFSLFLFVVGLSEGLVKEYRKFLKNLERVGFVAESNRLNIRVDRELPAVG